MFYFESIEPTRNRFRFYRVTVDRDLFAFTVTVTWGRLGSYSQRRILELSDPNEVLAYLKTIIKRRFNHRYNLVETQENPHLDLTPALESAKIA